MQVEEMKAFETVTKLTTISEAIRSLNEIQPCITARENKIESKVDSEWRFRTRYRVKLTKDGELLFYQWKQLCKK